MTSNAPLPKFTLYQRFILLRLGFVSWKIQTHTNADELIMLYYLSKSISKDSIAVEIGSYLGASSIMIALGLKGNSKLYCVDTWQNDAMTEGTWNSYNDFINNTKKMKNKIIPLCERSLKAANSFSEKIDLLFIDGDHSYQSVKADVEVWFEKLKPNGIIIMHDFGWAEGVIKVIDDIIKPKLNNYQVLPNMFWGWKI